MTALNMARHRNSPHMAFWRMLKQGHDHFEVTRLEPRVDVCERRYVFDAETTERFNSTDRCPFYRIPEEIVALVGEKQRRDEIDTVDLINRGMPTMPIATGADGGTNPAFAAAR
jgi:murein L,D-transpeptidase YafK